MRTFGTIALCILCSIAGAQGLMVKVDTLRAQRPFGPKEEYTFPVIQTPDRPEVGERINRNLRVELLASVCDSLPLTCLEAVWGDLDDAGNFETPELQYISWSVAQPFGSLLVVTFSAEGCGAYCEGFTTHRSYDLSFGTLVTWDLLLQKDERLIVEDSISNLWRERVYQELHKQKPELGVDFSSTEEMEHWCAVTELYKTCLEQRTRTILPLSSFEPLEHSLRVYVERCSNHADRSMDELGVVAVDLPYGWLEPYLTQVFRPLFIR